MFKFIYACLSDKFFKIQSVVWGIFLPIITFCDRACCKVIKSTFNFFNFYFVNIFITLASAALEFKDEEDCDPKEEKEEVVAKGKLFFWSPCKYWNARLLELLDYIEAWSKLSSRNTLITVFIIFLTLLIFKLTLVGIHNMIKEIKIVIVLAPEDRPDYIYYARLQRNGTSEWLFYCIWLYFVIELKMFIKTL